MCDRSEPPLERVVEPLDNDVAVRFQSLDEAALARTVVANEHGERSSSTSPLWRTALKCLIATF